ncbi:putative cyclic AMP receptor-like protein A isoform X2 [Apostichopus japonicus]|uniref:Putative cyclic AMP receptor-like protein A isoform X2 n=1 Tax=Stichopus japonicus TaxID=307972 RepID=A0A2G8JJ19_STIJA|nr:putative cyclic AMP receptor-like protein A isoform X2 [Apostichopus japonicus]
MEDENNTMQCTLFEEQGKCTAVVAVKKSMASFSLVGCVFMMLIIWIFAKYKVFVQRLILYLTIAAFFSSIGHLMAAVKPESPVCSFEAFWLTFSDWAVLLWVLIITINLFMNAVYVKETEKYEVIYSVIAWGFSLFMACLPFIGDNYGPAGAWCWIQEGSDVWRFVIWYIPLFITIGVLFVLYLMIIYKVNRQDGRWVGSYNPDNERQRQILKEYIRPLKAYPLIFLLLSIFPLINRMQNAFSKSGDPVFALSLLHAASSPLQGFVNAVVYGMDPETRSRLTWLQIKALLNKRSAHQPIREYPLVPAPETPDLEDVGMFTMKPYSSTKSI